MLMELTRLAKTRQPASRRTDSSKLDFAANKNDSDPNASHHISYTAVMIPQKRLSNKEEKIYALAKSLQTIKRQFRSTLGVAQLKRSRVATSVRTIVPSVPDLWRNMLLVDDADENVVALSTEKLASAAST